MRRYKRNTFFILCLLSLEQILAVDCGKPDDPIYGYHRKLSDDYTFKAEVEYACYYGYELQGGRKASCQSTGNWDSPSLPTCEGTKSISRYAD